MPKPIKKITKSSNRMIFGVCGGIGEYIKVDPTIIRILWVLITIFTNVLPGIIIYIVSAFIIPELSD